MGKPSRTSLPLPKSTDNDTIAIRRRFPSTRREKKSRATNPAPFLRLVVGLNIRPDDASFDVRFDFHLSFSFWIDVKHSAAPPCPRLRGDERRSPVQAG